MCDVCMDLWRFHVHIRKSEHMVFAAPLCIVFTVYTHTRASITGQSKISSVIWLNYINYQQHRQHNNSFFDVA